MANVEGANIVYVSNISPAATEKKVADFFSFCGKITQLYINREEGKETSSAVIHFETESAAKTALLLTSALIEDRPITVTAQQTVPQTTPGTPVPEEHITRREFSVPDEQRSKTSVVASLIAAGYILGQDALTKAQDLDEKHGFSHKAKVAVEQVIVKAQEIDKTYGISDKATALGAVVTEKATKINENYHISEKVSGAVQTAKVTVETVAAKAQENPHIAKGISTVTHFATNVQQTVNASITEYKAQIDKAIEEQKSQVEKAEAQHHAQSATPAVSEVTTGVSQLSTEEKKDPPAQ